MTTLIVAVVALLVIAAATAIGSRLGVASPLLLVLIGIGVSLLPFVPDVEIDPEWILAGVLPPLLYSASVSMPAMNFRRELRAISGLSVLLVVMSSVILGLFFSWAIPDLDLAWGIALGAIVSPTDAVATSIIKKVGVSSRVVTMLEGESLLNDATALVLLRSAIAAAAASVSFWGIAGTFLYSIAVATAIGCVVGLVNLWVRARVTDPTVNTVISFTVPFLASIPSEELGASGLVAAVAAGLVTGTGAARLLSPQHRLSDAQVWKAIEFILEGVVFLTMGLQLFAVMEDVRDAHEGVVAAALVGLAALVVTIVVRIAYVTGLLGFAGVRYRRSVRIKPRIDTMQSYLDDPEGAREALAELRAQRGDDRRREIERMRKRGGREYRRNVRRYKLMRLRRRPRDEADRGRMMERFRTRVVRLAADLDYLISKTLGWREGTVIVWAGMRGAVTLAAAQTLPSDTPQRSLLVFIAFVVAAASLLLQGGTIGWVVRLVKPAVDDPAELATERAELEMLTATAGKEASEDGEDDVGVIEAQRNALLEARHDGRFSAPALNGALAALDADQIRIELRSAPAEE